ncbi:Holliday junction resolvase-like protein [Anabaena cylindrica UHCC 0172]|uniref:Holliday junction resolvase-like protein n=1 Tax=Anabaena cylindrica TaxID=1165 RepID=UPI002B1FAFBA|nr:Holliday junction resolvase-like protein [Anabaena cylindrica]MEA5552089.1 Holliday junction resolvase-like protein [Anabaena cylindrica UHCC 0172]
MELFVLLLILVILGLSYQLYRANASVAQKAKEHYEAWKKKDYEYIKREQENIAQQKIALLVSEQSTKKAKEQYEIWCSQNIDSIRNEQREIAIREAKMQFQQWIEENSKSIREDAIHRSKSVIMGKVTEHFIPYLPDFSFNPKDARFVGSPVDFVVFDGLDEDTLRDIWFVEVKTASSSLSKRQRQIRQAIQESRVKWKELRRD